MLAQGRQIKVILCLGPQTRTPMRTFAAWAPILECSCTHTCIYAVYRGSKPPYRQWLIDKQTHSCIQTPNSFVHVFCLVMRACLHENNVIIISADTGNSDYYLNSVESRDISVFFRYFLWLSPLFIFMIGQLERRQERGERDGGRHAVQVAGSGVEPTNRLGYRSPLGCC